MTIKQRRPPCIGDWVSYYENGWRNAVVKCLDGDIAVLLHPTDGEIRWKSDDLRVPDQPETCTQVSV